MGNGVWSRGVGFGRLIRVGGGGEGGVSRTEVGCKNGVWCR